MPCLWYKPFLRFIFHYAEYKNNTYNDDSSIFLWFDLMRLIDKSFFKYEILVKNKIEEIILKFLVQTIYTGLKDYTVWC